ncbi:MAG: DUF3575 domain-containing protein [Cytophagaceae bacterium]
MLVAASGFAQKNVVKANLFGMFAGSYTLAYERVLNDKMSVQLSAGYRSYKYADITIGSINEKDSYSGPTVVGEFRYYVTNGSKDVPRGFYVAPFARYAKYTEKWAYTDASSPSSNYSQKWSTTSIAGGVMLGYQWLIADVVSIDLFAGPQYKTRSVSDITETDANGNTTTISASNYTFSNTKGLTSGVGPRVGLNVGVAF